MSPEPQDMSTTTPPAAGRNHRWTSLNSTSMPGKPAALKFWRQPRS